MLARTPPPLILTAPELFSDEHEMQIACTGMLLPLLLPEVTWTAIDHGHSFDKRKGRHGVEIGFLEARKRKRRGVKPGIPDYLFWHEGDAFAIELKMPGDGKLSDEQRDMLKALMHSGVLCRVCYSPDLVLQTCAEWHLLRGVHFGHNRLGGVA